MSEESVAEPAAELSAGPVGGDLVRRHSRVTRVWHWLNAVTLYVMLASGLMILNAHPRLYWGHYGADADNAWLELAAMDEVAFPGWLTLPSHYSLADARLWHLFFAYVLVLGLVSYLLWALLRGHLRKQIVPKLAELSPAHLWHDIKEHAALRFPTGPAALNYNILQKLAYGSVLLVLLPLVILTGLTMSPGMNAVLPLVDLFGGRQSARSLHFLAASGLVAFFVVHIAMVVLAGPINEVRSMITGWYRLPKAKDEGAEA
jgi:thiosulfate reductase cytochrome b subunit